MFENFIKNTTNETSDKMLKRLLTDSYDESLFTLLTGAQKLTLTNLMEAAMRGEAGTALYRPYGSTNLQSPWNKLFLSPTQLFKLPTENKDMISLETVIGSRCKRPITLSMPIMITGMSYGASLSLKLKTALAMAATRAGISTNTGESGLCAEEREAAKIIIGQYNRYHALMNPEALQNLDGIEVQLGQGAWGGAVSKTIYSRDIGEHMRNTWSLEEGQDAERTSRLQGVNTPQDVINLINNLKSQYDFPIGIKIAGSNFIEQELDVITQTDADFITIDGAEGGTAGAPPTLEDHLGLPTLHSLARAVKYLKNKNLQDKYDLIIAGGLRCPGEFLKALALGAKAVYIGSIAVVAALQSQTVKVTPFQSTPQLFQYTGKHADDFDVNEGADKLTNFLKSCEDEMKLSMMAMGKTNMKELSPEDLVSVDKDLAEALGIDFALK